MTNIINVSHKGDSPKIESLFKLFFFIYFKQHSETFEVELVLEAKVGKKRSFEISMQRI